MERNIENIKNTIVRIKEEERARKTKLEEDKLDKERRRDEKRRRYNDKVSEKKKDEEMRRERMEKKKRMEEKWRIVRWLTTYIEENQERSRKEREMRNSGEGSVSGI